MPRRYRSSVADSQRWDDFRLRPGDIIVTTPPKCGTTWTQMICALLILQTPGPARAALAPLAVDRHDHPIAPRRVRRPRRSGAPSLHQDAHPARRASRRPVGHLRLRRPRIRVTPAISMQHHRDNLDMAHVLQAQAEAAAEDGIDLEPAVPQPPRPDDLAGRFWQWVDEEPIRRRRCRASATRCTTWRRTAARPPTSISCGSTTTSCSRDLPGQMRTPGRPARHRRRRRRCGQRWSRRPPSSSMRAAGRR